MTARKKFRAIMSGKKLVLMPGAYDAHVRAHYRSRRLRGDRRRRLCRGRQPCWRRPTWANPTCATMPITTRASAAQSISPSMSMPIPALAASTMCGRWCAPSRRPASPDCSSATRCFPTAAAICRASRSFRPSRCSPSSRPRSTRAAIPTCSSPPAPMPPASRSRSRHRALPVVHGAWRRYGEAYGRRYHPRDQARPARGRRPAHGDAFAGRWTEGAQPRRFGAGRRLRGDLPVGRAVRSREFGAQRAAADQAHNSLSPCQEHLTPLEDYYDLVGLQADAGARGGLR